MELEIWMNPRRRDDGTFARHYKRPEQNQTLCGLSMKQGHAWDRSEAQFVTCARCINIAMKMEQCEEAR